MGVGRVECFKKKKEKEKGEEDFWDSGARENSEKSKEKERRKNVRKGRSKSY